MQMRARGGVTEYAGREVTQGNGQPFSRAKKMAPKIEAIFPKVNCAAP
jgi:hypothetical protein